MSDIAIAIAEQEIAVFYFKFYCSHVAGNGLIIRYSLIQSAMERLAKSHPEAVIPYKRYVQIFDIFAGMMVKLEHFSKSDDFYYLIDGCD